MALGLTAVVSWVVYKMAFVGQTSSGAIQVTWLGSLILSPAFGLISSFALLGFLIYMNMNMETATVGRAQKLFFGYAAAVGVVLSPVALVYTGSNIAHAFLITAVSFGALSLYGYTTKRDLAPMGAFMFMGLIGLILCSLVNYFLASSGLNFAISVLGVVIFAGLTAWDTQKIKSMYYTSGRMQGAVAEKRAIFGATMLYLDFLNMFLFFLRLTSGDRR